MGRDRTRVLAFALAYVVLGVLSTFVLDWFVLEGGGRRISVGLRDATVCDGGHCAVVGFGKLPGIGMYSSAAWTAFWGTLLMSLLVGFQVVTRVASGVANARLSRKGIFAGLSMLANAGAAGYLFAPEVGPVDERLGLGFETTAAPILMMLAHAAGVLAMYYASLDRTEDDVAPYRPVRIAKPAAEGTPSPSSAAPAAAPARPAPASARPAPHPSFAALTAELSRAGIDARREDGKSLLVLWRDVVGVVARRPPPELGGDTFVDLISTPGSTLRLVARTRLMGEPLLGATDADGRARAFVTFVAAHCPRARIDPATIAFVEQDAPAAQLADAAELAAYDARLA